MAEKPEEKLNANKIDLKPIVHVDNNKVRKSTGRQFFSSLVTHDFSVIWDYLIDPDEGVVTNALRSLGAEVGCSIISMIFKQDVRKRSPRSWNSDPNRKDYGSIYRTTSTGYLRQEERSYESISARRSSMDYMDIPFSNRADAEAVLEQMRDILEQYPSVSVANFYDLVDYDYGSNWTVNDYGWTDLSNVVVTWSHGAWIIGLPKAVSIK